MSRTNHCRQCASYRCSLIDLNKKRVKWLEMSGSSRWDLSILINTYRSQREGAIVVLHSRHVWTIRNVYEKLFSRTLLHKRKWNCYKRYYSVSLKRIFMNCEHGTIQGKLFSLKIFALQESTYSWNFGVGGDRLPSRSANLISASSENISHHAGRA